MSRRLLIILATALILQALLTTASASRRTVRVAFVHDREAADWAVGFRDSLRQEIKRLLEVDHDVQMPPDLDLIAYGTPLSVHNLLERLQRNEGVDLIVATGPLGSREAGLMSNLTRPVIGTWVLDPGIQQLPYTDGVSGRSNYTYITVGNLFDADLDALAGLVEYDHLAVVGSTSWVETLRGDRLAAETSATGRISFVTGGNTVDSILAALPYDADAIYLLPRVDLDSAEIAALLAAFIERDLPVISLIGEPEVRAGALVGVAPADWKQRVYRRVALTAAQILAGEDPSRIPVMMMRDRRIFLNLRTADLIGISPPFEVIIEAILVDEPARPSGGRFNLQDAMAAAQSLNRDISTGERAVAAGREQVSIARAKLLPQIHLGAGGFVVDKDRAAFFPMVSERTFAGRATLTQLLYADGTWADYSIEKHLQEARTSDLKRVRLDIGLETATAYLEVLRSRTRLQIQRRDLAFSRQNLERAEVRVSVGDADRSELYRWRSKIASDQTHVMQAVVNQRQISLELNRVLARPLETPLDLVDNTIGDQYRKLVDPRLDRFLDDPASLNILRDFLVSKGLAGAPELQQFDAEILATERAHTAANRSFWAPDIELAGTVNQVFARGGEGSAGDDDTFWNVGVFLSLPLLEGGARFAETHRTTQETLRLIRGREAASERIEQNVRHATFQIAASRLAIDLARKAADAASRNLELVADNYILGRVSLVDLLDAQTTALNTGLAASDAVNDYLLDLMNVERAVGRFMFFVSAEDREAWIEELAQFERERS